MHTTNRKILAGLLASTLLMTSLSAVALAAENEQMLISPSPVIAPLEKQPFADMPNNHWAAASAQEMVSRGYLELSEGNRFAPNTAASRAELTAALWRMSGKPVINFAMQFEDVSSNSSDAEAIRWAAGEKIASGYGNGNFGPDDPLTRAQLATIVYRYIQKYDLGFHGTWMFLLSYDDAAEIPAWASEPVHWMVANQIMSGSNDHWMPNAPVTRAEEAAVLSRLCALAADKCVDFAVYPAGAAE